MVGEVEVAAVEILGEVSMLGAAEAAEMTDWEAGDADPGLKEHARKEHSSSGILSSILLCGQPRVVLC